MRWRLVGGAAIAAVLAALAAGLLSGCVARSGTEAGAPQVGDSAVAATARATSSAPAHATTSAPKRLAPDACAHNTAAQRVIVDISQQHAWMCARGHTVYQTAVTTGAVALPYDSTPLGTFHIQGRNTDTTLTLADGSTYQVRYWIPFDAPLFGFHDAGWQKFPFGSAAYRTQGSHGCVHMPLAAMSYLYRWAKIGASVTIRA